MAYWLLSDSVRDLRRKTCLDGGSSTANRNFQQRLLHDLRELHRCICKDEGRKLLDWFKYSCPNGVKSCRRSPCTCCWQPRLDGRWCEVEDVLRVKTKYCGTNEQMLVLGKGTMPSSYLRSGYIDCLIGRRLYESFSSRRLRRLITN